MRLKDAYEQATIDIITFRMPDIVTSSGDIDESMGTGSGNGTDAGWTPIGW